MRCGKPGWLGSAMFQVLLVETNQAYRAMLNEVLLQRFPRLRIEQAGDKDQALRLSDSCSPDLILMDIHVSMGSGLELTRIIKASHPHTVVIVLSGYDLPEYRDTFERFGADYFIGKNSSLQSLFDLVEGIILNRSVH